MKIGMLPTGMVGRSHGAKLRNRGHVVMIGTRNVERTFARRSRDALSNPPFSEWLAANPGIMLGNFVEVAQHGEVLINGTEGTNTTEALQMAGEEILGEKAFIGVSNPLYFSRGVPSSLFVLSTDSLAEHIHATFLKAKVVKALNTMTALIQVEPGRLAKGDHHAFVSGNDQGACEQVVGFLRDWYGWQNVINLGDLPTARGLETVLPMWLRIYRALQTPMLNFKIVTVRS